MGRLADAWAGLTKRSTLDAVREQRPVSFASADYARSMTLELDAESRGWTHSAVAYRCVAQIADNGSSVNLEITRNDGSVIDNHPIANLLNKRPNPQMASARTLKSVWLQQLKLAGRSFAFCYRGESMDPDAPVQAIYPVYDDVTVYVARRAADDARPADIIGYTVNRADGIRVPVLPDEMLYFRYPHPFDPMASVAPWKAARHAVDVDAFAREWQRSSLENGAQPGGVVYLGDMSPDEFVKAKASFRATVEGPANARKHLLVASPPGSPGKGVEYVRLGLTAEEVSYLETRVQSAEEVMLAFGMPRDLLLGGATYENRAASKTALWSDTIVPDLEIIASEIDRVLLPSDDENAGFDLSGVDALQEAQDSVANRLRALVYADIAKIDEARAAVGWDPLPGGIGDNTLTPYRAQFAPVQGAPGGDDARSWDADFSRVPTRPAPDLHAIVRQAVADAVPAVVAALTQFDALPAPRRAELTRADDAPSSPSVDEVNEAYDELERSARRVVQALAKEQRERVLRDFDRLMGKPQRSALWLEETRAHACALAREQSLTLAPPDPDVVPAARMTELDIAAGPEGWEERIKVREIFDPRYWRRRTVQVLRPVVERAWKRGGTTISGSFDLDEPDVEQALRDRVDELAGQVTATTEAVLRSQLLAHGVAEGESIPELRDRIQRVFTELSDYRATMIARTESVGGYNAASHMAALDAGATRKTWLSTDDTRTRRTHRAAQGKSVAMNKRFELTESRWPCDPAAPANQSIQCRCALTFHFDEES
ncbi:phage portal protein [Streptomyces sp. NPDC014986]|uniref:phage portal protein n=1 Tax=Streptomyces sp. NPDC014986 TaxID=3364934 RepID=UPI0036F6180C